MDPDPELREITEDQDAEDGQALGLDDAPDVKEDSVAEFEPLPENDPEIEGDAHP